jgi:uncharacterized small protein (DUF1192 family)
VPVLRRRDDMSMISAERMPAPVPDENSVLLALATSLYEIRSQFAELNAEIATMRAEIDRLSGRLPERRQPPAGWVNLKTIAGLAGVSIETARLWAINNMIAADMFSGRWFADPTSLRLERHT